MNKLIRNKKIKFYFVYTLLFALFMGAILFLYYSKNKSMANYGGDGYRQFYRALLYISNYYKQILYNVFIEHNFIIPQWDFVIGEGSDILESLHYYGLGDPLNLFSVFFNENNLYIFFDLCVFLRMYLSGIVFSRLCFYKKNNNYYAILTGSILYAYCSYAINAMSAHITFLNSLLYFPLVILGVEKLIDENKHVLLVVSVFLISITSIYFFYMIAVLTAIYSIVRIALLKINNNEKIIILCRIAVFSIVGLLISSFIFLPTANSMLDNSRISDNTECPLFYSLDYYLGSCTSIIYNYYSGAFFGGYTILGFLSIACIFNKKNSNKLFKILIVLLIIFLSIPFFGKLLNAMTYVTNRWQFCFSLLVNYCIVISFDEIIKLSKKYILLILFYSLFCMLYNVEEWKIYFAYLMAGCLMIVLLNMSKTNKAKHIICLCVVLFSLALNMYYKYSVNYWNYAKNGTDISIIQEANSIKDITDSIDDDTFYRYSGNSLADNISINGNKSSTGYYWSVANDKVMEFRKEVALLDINNHHYNDYDDDYVLNCLASVKYYISNDDIVPYNYDLYNSENGLYINTDALSIVYGYSNCISKENWLNLPILERREILSNCVVIDEETDDYKYISEIEQVEYSISYDSGIEAKDNVIIVNNKDSKVKITLDSSADGDYFILLKDLKTDVDTRISLVIKGEYKEIVYKTEENVAYAGRHNFLINIGNQNSTGEEILLNFADIGEYQYDSISIIRLPLKKIKQNIGDLNCVYIDNMALCANNIKMDIRLDEDKYLCFSIPHYSGWKAYLDGEEVELSDYNIMYMGFFASAGTHNIELVYSTPLLKEGSTISIAMLLCFVLYEIISPKHTKTKNVI